MEAIKFEKILASVPFTIKDFYKEWKDLLTRINELKSTIEYKEWKETKGVIDKIYRKEIEGKTLSEWLEVLVNEGVGEIEKGGEIFNIIKKVMMTSTLSQEEKQEFIEKVSKICESLIERYKNASGNIKEAIKYIKQIKGSVDNLMTSLSKEHWFLKKVSESFEDNYFIKENLEDLIDKLKEVAKNIWNWIKEKISGLINNIKNLGKEILKIRELHQEVFKIAEKYL